MKLSYKIFGAFILTFVLSLVLMVVVLRIHASMSFSNFVNDLMIEKLDNLKISLVQHYRTEKNWDDLRSDPREFRTIVEASLPPRGSGLPGRPGLNHDNFPPGPQGRHVPPHPDFHDKDPEFGKMPMPPMMMGPRGLIDRISLFDENKKHVAGRSPISKENTLGAISLNGKVIGYIGINKRIPFLEPRERGFLKQQFRAFYFIALGVLLLSGLVSFILSRHMVSPIKRLIKSTRDVADFKFNTRITIQSKDELGQLAQDFNTMAMTLEKYETIRKQWISDVSHELRTPLTVLQAEVEALEDGLRELNRESLNSLHKEISHIIKIVNDLHDLSLSDSGTLYFKMEAVNPVVKLIETLHFFNTAFEKQGLTLVEKLSADPGIIITGDGDRLVQMYSNILENCLKYTTKPGTLTVRQKMYHKNIVLSFEDSGPGVPEESVSRLFDRLYRVDPSRSRTGGGSGLGLSICKNIAETLGGRITARNTKSGGLSIDIDLPLGNRK